MEYPPEEHVYTAVAATTEETTTPNIGDQVLYVLPDGQTRPAFIVRTWNSTCVNLQVLLDGTNDFVVMGGGNIGMRWKTSVYYSAGKEPGTWHYKETR